MSVADPTTTSAALVSTSWAREHLDDPKVRFLEVDVDTDAYDTGHLPGATGINWKSQLTDPVMRDLVSREELQSLLRAAGVNDDTTIVLYGDNNNWFAAWAYWQLRYQGLDNVRLLDGGRIKVEADGLALTTDAPSHAAGSITLPDHTREELRAYRQQVIDGIGSSGVTSSTSARPRSSAASWPRRPTFPRKPPSDAATSPARSTCRGRPPWPRTAPSSRSISCASCTPPRASPATTRSSPTAASASDRATPGSCCTSCLGYRNVRNYDGSWTEYGSLVGVPIEIGEASSN